MKKIIFILLLLFIFYLPSCKNNKNDKFTISYLVDGKLFATKTVENGSTIPLIDCSKENQIFLGWSLNDNLVDEGTVAVTDTTLIAKFRDLETYTVKFVNFNKLVFKTVEVKEGEKLEYPDTNPTHYSTDESIYVFDGWDINIEYVTSDLTITATFKEETRYYTIKFLNSDGTLIQEQKLAFGENIIAPSNPTMDEDEYYSYEFTGWDGTVKRVVDDETFTAQYKMNFKWKNISLEGKIISFLGDSVSTFYSEYSSVNSYYHKKDTYYYPVYSSSIKTVNKTWWYQTYTTLGMNLGVNNSWSGSCASGNDQSVATSDSRINTLDDNGSPDIVVIYLGVNDNVNGYSVEQYISAMNTIIDKIRKISHAQIYIMGLQYSEYWKSGKYYTEERRINYNNALKTLANDRQCVYIPLDEYITEENYSGYMGDMLHYNAEGATVVAEVTIKTIKKSNGIVD